MKKIVRTVVITLLFAFVSFYFTLPALNLRSPYFYSWLLEVAVVYMIASLIGTFSIKDLKNRTVDFAFLKKNAKLGLLIVILCIATLGIGQVASHQFFHAGAYQKLIPVENREFTEDIAQVSMKDVPIVDKDSAIQLGNRKIGELVNLISQFEVDEYDYSYTQINYRDIPTRVAPLRYGNIIKWFNNQSNGIPGYISVNMTTQDVELVQLEEGIRYSPGEYFFRDLDRHLRFQYPTKIFEDYSFEVDDDGKPYWICPVINYTIGLFGGRDVKGVVIVNACNGDSEYYDIQDVPQWVDRAYSADIIVEQINYWGKYKNGYINTIFGQRDVCVTSGGYNYLAIDDDVWLYTGLTSVGNDESNIGLVLVNMRTKEARYYIVSGATEYSAMDSAEGQVQNLAYKATFPVLLNIGGQPTYLVSLKDNAGLVKKFAFVNVEKYQQVAIGDTLDQAYAVYVKLLSSGQIIDASSISEITGTVTQVDTAVKDGNTYFYVQLSNSKKIFVASIQLNDVLAVLQPEDRVTIGYVDSDSDFIMMNQIERK
ncbi:MAG: CvpA family protein [Frisingicoccus sp.]|uniref:CvpA family protein n=1 Tax=Frisingicoccus sp. TaxID=1918627 RepID=UPI00260F2C0E|nr:CvpA family protein [Frisingicoccus sp.]MDD6231708.1 CvpA family protein [Frisingicoccus sp.]